MSSSSDQKYWCPQDATALTDSQIYHSNLLGPSIYVKFDLSKEALQSFVELQTIARNEGAVRTSIIVWTSAPWTLIANWGVLLRPKAEYVAIKAPTIDGTEIWIVAKDSQATFEKAVGFGDKVSTPLLMFPATKLQNQKANHPWLDRFSMIFLNGEHGHSDLDTGVMPIPFDFHPAPGEKIYSNENVIDTLRDSGHLAAQTEIRESYPYCVRCRNPVIIRGPNLGFLPGSEIIK